MGGIGRVGLLLAAVSAASLQPLHAADLKLDRAGIGFAAEVGPQKVFVGAVAGLDAWLPCDVVLSNKGGAPYDGTLVLSETPTHLGGTTLTRRPITYRRKLTLEPGATKRVRFPVLFDGSQIYSLSFDDASRGRIQLGSTGDRLRLPVEVPPTQPVVLVARRRDVTTGLLSHLNPTPPPNQLAQQVKEWLIAEVNPDLLPDDPVLYHRVAALVLDDIALGRLDLLQQEAILAFVARGGQLWISTVTRSEDDASSPLSRALPGKPGKVRTLGDLPAVEAVSGKPYMMAKARSVRTFTPAPGATSWSSTNEVVHRRYGQGRIVQAGYRLTDPTVPGGEETIRSLLRTRTKQRLWLPSSYSGPLLKTFDAALRRTTRKSVPSLQIILALLTGYVLLAVLLPFLITRGSGRLERAWVVVALMSLGGTGGVALLGTQYEQPSQAIRVSLVEGGGVAGPHQQVSLWALFSRQGGTLPLTFKHDRVTPFPYEQSSPGRLGAEEARAQVATHPQDTTLLVTTEPVALPGGLRFRVRGPEGPRLENGNRIELINAWAFGDDGEPLRLDLPKGMTPLSDADRAAFEPSVNAAQKLAETLARNRSRPILLWAAPSPGALGDLPERGLTLGILEAEDFRPAFESELVCLPRLKVDDMEAQVREWEFLTEIPPGVKILDVRLEWRPSHPQYGWRWRNRRFRGRRRVPKGPKITPQVFDKVGQRWLVTGTSGRRYRADRFLYRDPLGLGRIRLRFDGPPNYEPRVHLITGNPR